MLIFTDTMQTHNKNINDRQQSWLDAQKAARPLCRAPIILALSLTWYLNGTHRVI